MLSLKSIFYEVEEINKSLPTVLAAWQSWVKWLIFLFLLLLCLNGFSQEEGPLTKKVRAPNSKVMFLQGGPLFKFGNNTGDYSGGLSFQGGFFTRLNKFISLGPFISYSKFNYDESISDSFGDKSAKGNNVFVEQGGYEAKVVYMEGGDLSFVGLGMNAKFNVIALTETSKFSVYGIAKPFILLAKRTEITATSESWYMGTIGDDPLLWTFNAEEFLDSKSPNREHWASKTEFSGGMDLGVGGEIALPSGLGFYLQTTIGFTLPVSYINTIEFPATLAGGYNHPDYPLVKKGFTTLNVSIGINYIF